MDVWINEWKIYRSKYIPMVESIYKVIRFVKTPFS